MTSSEVIRDIFGKKIGDAFVDQLCAEKERIFRTDIKENAAYLPGVERWLKKFLHDGVPQALASSGSKENIDTVLETLNCRRFFNVIVSGKNLPSKPEPEIFLQAAKELKTLPESCLVIEDAIAGVAGAKAAGMKCLAVTTTNLPAELADADLILDNLEYMSPLTIKTLFP